MDFWNEYEGKTIAESYPLEKLLYPEGRSGFFSTRNGTGTLAVIRLTESLNDQQEMLQQWQIVRGLNHPNLIAILKCDQTIIDGVPLVYAVLEPTDATLADILAERPMTVDETEQIATSLVAALQALHSNGLVHERIEPGSVRAVGEVVKLRSDCVRRVPDPGEQRRLISRDVRDLCMVLYQALTRERVQPDQSSPIPALPSPFDRIVPNGVRGQWGLEEISTCLQSGAQVLSNASIPAVIADAETVQDPEPDVPAMVEANEPKVEAQAARDEAPLGGARQWWRNPILWPAIVLLILVAIIAWHFWATHFLRSSPPNGENTATSSPSVAAPTASAPAPTATTPAPTVNSATAKPAAADVWRLVVYTYNREGEAEKKVTTLKQNHAAWTPEVFTPTGHAPYLVTLGGHMSHQGASELLRKAVAAGLPRDSYVQNYNAR